MYQKRFLLIGTLIGTKIQVFFSPLTRFDYISRASYRWNCYESSRKAESNEATRERRSGPISNYRFYESLDSIVFESMRDEALV